jgi:hypothetical protein
MVQYNDLASRLLRFEQQLTAYQKLHEDELAELWQVLNECKYALVAALPSQDADHHLKGSPGMSRELRGKEK